MPMRGHMAPPLDSTSGGLLSRLEHLSPQGVLRLRDYRTFPSPLLLEFRAPAAGQATPSSTVYRPACHW